MTFTATQQDIIDDFRERTSKCEDLKDLVEIGAELFVFKRTWKYNDEEGHGVLGFAVTKCWPIFCKRVKEIAPDDAGKSVIVYDFPAIFWAAYSKSGAECGHEVMSRIATINSEISKEANPSVIIAHDSTESVRRTRYPQYKSSRESKPPEFVAAREDVIALLKNNGFTVVVESGWESDDVMASAAFRAKLRKQNCTIVTDDRDLLQCCGSGVTCYSPRNHNYLSDTWLQATHGLSVKQLVDWLCMSGKDDVPSIHGIGEKTAAQLLQKYGDFEGVYYARSTLTEKKSKAVEEFWLSGKYCLAHDLHTLNRKIPVWW